MTEAKDSGMNAAEAQNGEVETGFEEPAFEGVLEHAKQRAFFVGTVLPVVLLAVSTVMQIAWLSRMPDPAAIHWNGAGMPDGFGAPWTTLVMMGLVSIGLLILSVIQRAQMGRRVSDGRAATWSFAHRAMPAFVLGLMVMLQFIAVGTTWVQLDATDARDTGSALWVFLGAWGAAIVVGLLGYFFQPRVLVNTEDVTPAAAPIESASVEHAVWVGKTGPSAGVLWGVVATLAFGLGISVWAISQATFEGLISVGAILLVALLLVSFMWFRVRIDATGFEARSVVGWPVFRVPAAEIDSVVVARIDPLGEFAGWGLRFGGGRTGIVPRGGEGMIVTRENGRAIVITMDGAEQAAAVLQTVARAARANDKNVDSGNNDTKAEA